MWLFIQGSRWKLILSDDICEGDWRRLSISLQKTQTKSTSTKPTCITSIFICHSDAKARKQPLPEPSISWTHHVFIISRKMGIDGNWVQLRVITSSTAHIFVEGKHPFLKLLHGWPWPWPDFWSGRESNKILLPLFACLGGIIYPVQREGESKLAAIRLLLFWVP